MLGLRALMKVAGRVCPKCGKLGSGIYWKVITSKGKPYRYAYFAHRDKKLKWCYIGKIQLNDTNINTNRSIDRSLLALLHAYIKYLKGYFGRDLVAVALFGSAARGEAEFPISDIDLLLVVSGLEGKSLGERVRLLSAIEKDFLKGEEYIKFSQLYGEPFIQAHILTPDEVSKHPPILLDVITDGIIIYDDDNFLIKELNRLRRRMKELGAEKVRLSNGSWYWKLKPSIKWGEVVEL
ncbi:MAG: nucleotidyltransferase domain-containing protein [Nitrososphaerales archaeon]|nr:nucleotidyltransferase domain-containing protein [Nitrososphaerales archaeon]